MNGDNPTVSQALRGLKKETDALREKHEQRTLFKNLTDKIESLAKTNDKLNKTVEKDPFNKETFVKSFLSKKLNTDFISSMVLDKIKSFNSLHKQPEKMFTPVSMEEIRQGPVIDNFSGIVDVSKEDTQKKVLSSLQSLTQSFPDITKPFVYLSKKLFELKDITKDMNKTVHQSLIVESDIKTSLEEQNENFRTWILRQQNRELPDFSKMGLTFFDRLKKGLEDTFKQIVSVGKTKYEEKTSERIKKIIGSGGLGLKGIGWLLKFVGELSKMLLPFKTIMLGGAAISMIYSMFNFIGDFTKTSEAVSKLFSEGLSNVGPNLLNVFQTLAQDFLGMFETSEKMKELIQNMSNLFSNHIMPAFQAIVGDVLVRMADNIKMLFEKYIEPGVEAFNAWWNSSGPQDIDRYITNFTNIFIDGLNILFRDILPPVFDLVTKAIKTLMPVIETVASIVRDFIYVMSEVLPGLFRGILRLGNDIIEVVSGVIQSLAQIITPDSFSDFVSGIENLVFAVGKFIINTVDNLVTTIFDVFKIDEIFGINPGETVLEAIGRFFNYIGTSIENFFRDIRNGVVSIIDESIAFIIEYNPITIIQEKIKDLFQSILNMIPSMDDMVNVLRSGAQSIGVPDWLINKLVGEERQVALTPTSNTSEIKSLYDMIAQNSTALASPTIVYAPTTNNSSAPKSRNSGSRVSGIPRTTAEQSPSDRHLSAF